MPEMPTPRSTTANFIYDSFCYFSILCREYNVAKENNNKTIGITVCILLFATFILLSYVKIISY